jgi:6-phosphofructokinase 1
MNAAIRGVVRCCSAAGSEVVGIRRGFCGLIDCIMHPLGPRDVANILQRGGSILDTSREPRFLDPEVRRRAIDTLDRERIDALVTIGGNGTQQGSRLLQDEWTGSVIGVASTIDNDLGGTDTSIGFDTACNTALEAIDRIRDTANSLDRLFFIEVMGRRAGFIALEVAVGGGAEAVLLPEVELNTDWLVEVIRANHERGKISCIIVVAEGAHPGGARGLLQEIEEPLGDLGLLGSADARVTILGHIQRGGNPTVRDRVLASRLSTAAARAALANERGLLFGIRGNKAHATPFADALAEKKEIDHTLLELVNELAG